MRPVITLLSDWRLRDPYIAMLKGMIYNVLPDAKVLDLTHYVDKFNVLQSAIITKSSYKSFPEGSVHLILTNVSMMSSVPPVLLKFDNHYFICPDNGIFYLMFGQKLSGFQLIDKQGNTISQMLKFLECLRLDNLEQSAEIYSSFKMLLAEEADWLQFNKTIEGKIVYIDAFNNAVTNIPAEMFHNAVQDKKFTAQINSKGEWKIEKFFADYENVNDEMFFTENALGLIEIASYQADVAILADLEVDDRIVISYD